MPGDLVLIVPAARLLTGVEAGDLLEVGAGGPERHVPRIGDEARRVADREHPFVVLAAGAGEERAGALIDGAEERGDRTARDAQLRAALDVHRPVEGRIAIARE